MLLYRLLKFYLVQFFSIHMHRILYSWKFLWVKNFMDWSRKVSTILFFVIFLQTTEFNFDENFQLYGTCTYIYSTCTCLFGIPVLVSFFNRMKKNCQATCKKL